MRASQTPTQSSQGDAKRQRVIAARRRATTPRITRLPKGQGLPLILRNTHKYAANIGDATSTGGVAVHIFNANGMFDPDATLGGTHQPHYFDQLAALYNHYRVVSSTIKVSPIEAPDAFGYTYTLFLDDDSAPILTNQYDAWEREGAVVTTGQLQGNQSRPIFHRYNAAKWFGATKSNDSQVGTVAANPSETACWTLQIQGTPSKTYTFLVQIEYVAIWDELKSVPAS